MKYFNKIEIVNFANVALQFVLFNLVMSTDFL